MRGAEMGSQPWKQATLNRWEDEFSGKSVIVRNPGRIYDRADNVLRMESVEGRYLGNGSRGGKSCVFIHQRPDMHVRDPGFWDHEVIVILERGMAVESRASDEERQDG